MTSSTLPLLLALLAASGPPEANDGTGVAATVTGVEVRSLPGAVEVVIRSSRPPSFTTFSAHSPPRFVVDFPGSSLQDVAEPAGAHGTVRGVQAMAVGGEGLHGARVVIALAREVEPPEVRLDGSTLVVTFASPASATASGLPPSPTATATPTSHPPATATATATPTSTSHPTPTATATSHPTPTPTATATSQSHPNATSTATPTSTATASPTPTSHPHPHPNPPATPHPPATPTPPPSRQVKEVGFRQLAAGSRVFIRLSSPPRFSIGEAAGGALLRVELQGTEIAPDKARRLDTSFFRSAVTAVTAHREGTTTVVEIALRAKVPHQQRIEGDTLILDFAPLPEPAP